MTLPVGGVWRGYINTSCGTAWGCRASGDQFVSRLLFRRSLLPLPVGQEISRPTCVPLTTHRPTCSHPRLWHTDVLSCTLHFLFRHTRCSLFRATWIRCIANYVFTNKEFALLFWSNFVHIRFHDSSSRTWYLSVWTEVVIWTTMSSKGASS